MLSLRLTLLVRVKQYIIVRWTTNVVRELAYPLVERSDKLGTDGPR